MVTGIIDLDGIRRNRPFRWKNPAKDLAGLNHPGLPLACEEKASLLGRYLDKMKVTDREKFQRMVMQYTDRRWKKSA
jgi:hypothetical protein